MDKIQIIESELISLQYADEQMLDFLVTDLGNRAILVAETFYLEFKYCTQINIDNDLMNTLFYLDLKLVNLVFYSRYFYRD
ncbi:MAG: hypothetical protein ACLRZ2_05710 [Veillonella sp.]